MSSHATAARHRMLVEEGAMGAEILGCGHASQLFKVEYLDGSPQVHLHFLTDDEEFEREGFGKIEFVCHGCGAGTLLYYDNSGSRRQYLGLRNRFRDAHRDCKNRNYERNCPDYRRALRVMDVRRAGYQFKRARIAS